MKTIIHFCAGLCLFLATAVFASRTPAPILLHDFKLTGDLTNDTASFTLIATAKVDNAQGGSIELLSGVVALTEIADNPKWHLQAEQNRYLAVFERGGEFPIKLKFNAAVRQTNGWSGVEFCVPSGTLQSVTLRGLAADTQFQFPGAAKPRRSGGEFNSYLPSDGAVKLAWKETRTEAVGKLFYAAEMFEQITVSPGLMRQTALLDFKVMQGELKKVTLLMRGAGEVTKVQGPEVLAWNVEPVTNSADHLLTIQLNQPQKDQFQCQVQMQTPLGAFPQTTEAIQLRPDGATRFAGYIRIVNEGAVRLEVVQSSGVSQISPEQFPETDATRAILRMNGNQRFAYRFSGADFALRIEAGQIFHELTVSQVLTYHHGENDLAIDAEIELDIREAPLRELLLRVPKGYAVVKVNAPSLNDYFLGKPGDESDAELRLIYGQPVTGRQVIQLRLEHNHALGETNWTLPRIEVAKAKSVRGFIGVASDPGFRLTTERSQSLTEIATAFVPQKISGLQAAFRLGEPAWQATLHVERLPQTVHADVFHLFSIGEGIAYGSTVMNYQISGAPVSALKVELSGEYANIEFTGKDIRNWQKTDGGYLVQLHTPVSGAYTLLATYERPFLARGDTLAFTGARPLDAQSEQGHTLIVSADQFQVKPVEVSPGLLPLETAEVPAEYRLFFDAPILAAYRYTSRPFNLKLGLSPLAQGESLSQIVDRASLTTHISKEGQVLTDAHYFIKNRGHTHFRLTLPAGTQLWSATIDGAAVTPVIDGSANLVPLPARNDPNSVLKLDLKLATQSKDAKRVKVAAPILTAPVMLEEWKFEPDTGQQLALLAGSLSPVSGEVDSSGFAALARLFDSGGATHDLILLLMAVVVMIGAWRWGSSASVFRFSGRHIIGGLVGIAALVLAAVTLIDLAKNSPAPGFTAGALSFLAPVQQSESALTVEVSNLETKATSFGSVHLAWPALLAVLVWFAAMRRDRGRMKTLAIVGGWTSLAWAALRYPNGAPAFFIILMLFLLLRVVFPAFRPLLQLPQRPIDQPDTGTAPAIVAVLIGCFFCIQAQGKTIPESVSQTIRVEENLAFATAKIHWQAKKGDTLPLFSKPTVLTKILYPVKELKLEQASIPQLVTQQNGTYDIELHYELPIAKKENEAGFTLPVGSGLINSLNLTVINLDVDVFSPQSVSMRRETSGSNTVATLVLSPSNESLIAWKPRSRDVKHEKAVFYADLSQLYIPAAGVIEGVHTLSIRPAQGEISELTLNVPKGVAITDVASRLVSLWRFDPDTRKLRVTLNPAQSKSFGLIIRSQVATGPLPFEQSVGLLSIDNAAGQIGLLGVATGNEVQLDNVTAENFSPINLEDFPAAAVDVLSAQISGLAVRRAFRYSDSQGVATIKASAVEPDVRVEMQSTLSLGDDRTVLAADAAVEITRAGIFKLSFLMPAGFDVEAITGAALSHWTESKTDAGRLITLHLTGKTEGAQPFSISLAGPGTKPVKSWHTPQIVLREAGKQRGSLVIVPEQGMRLQVATRDGLTQLDPQKSGIKQKGVIAFRVLQTPSNLALDIEQVDPWIQVTSLQHALVNEAQIKVSANLQYQIENTGLKSFRVWLPTNSESVRFQGDQVADFLQVPGAATNDLQQWEIKLHRRVIGQYLLQLTYQTLMPDQASEALVRGIQASEVNLQRGFVTLQTGGRLQVRVDNLPPSLQPTEWQSIPRALQQDLSGSAANFAYRLVEPSFQLPLKLERHEAVKLLPARVNNITFNTVISHDGITLTEARLEILPGDKRLLNLTLPKDANFWFAFVNQNGVWPWRQQDRILIPLEKQSQAGKPILVEFYYSLKAGPSAVRNLSLDLLAPKFDLPLENMTWRVSVGNEWKLKDWTGSLQLQEAQLVPQAMSLDLDTYLQHETEIQHERTKEAEGFMTFANSALEKGDPQQARRAFQAAYGLSTHDAAFNEDARVQLHNIKLQQALIGLNVRNSSINDVGALAGKLRDLKGREEVNYTQQDAKDIIDHNPADENAALMKLAEQLVRQQDAAITSPTAIRASIPEQGNILTFKRAVVVDTWADLKIGLKLASTHASRWPMRLLMLTGIFLVLALLSRVTQPAPR